MHHSRCDTAPTIKQAVPQTAKYTHPGLTPRHTSNVKPRFKHLTSADSCGSEFVDFPYAKPSFSYSSKAMRAAVLILHGRHQAESRQLCFGIRFPPSAVPKYNLVSTRLRGTLPPHQNSAQLAQHANSCTPLETNASFSCDAQCLFNAKLRPTCSGRQCCRTSRVRH